MAAVVFRLRVELRQRWRAWLGLALLAGTFGGAVLAAGAAATRTDSVLDRLVARTQPPHIYYIADFQRTKVAVEDLEPLPSVTLADDVHWYPVTVPAMDDAFVETPAPNRDQFERFEAAMVLLEGRHPDPDRIDEATVNFIAQRELGVGVGDTLEIELAAPGWDPSAGDTTPGERVTVRIVGVVTSPGDLPSVAEPGLRVTPAFDEAFAERASFMHLVMLTLDNEDYTSFSAEVRSVSGDEPLIYAELRSGLEQTRRSFRLQTLAWWTVAIFLAFVGIVILGQTLARQANLESSDVGALSAIGMSRRQRFAIAMLRSAGIGAIAAPFAFAIAYLSSTATPIGLARFAEPDPGLRLDPATMLAGAVLVAVLVVILAAPSAWLSARIPSALPPATRRPRLAALLAALGRDPAATTGIRFATDPGSGRSAVPIRSTMIACVAALVALVVATTVGSSIGALVSTPRLFGWNWDLGVPGDYSDQGDDLEALLAIDGVTDVAVGVVNAPFTLEGTQVEGYAMSPRLGSLGPVLLEGRLPGADDEILVGPKTLEATGLAIGDTTEVGLQGVEATVPARIVGTTVLPLESDLAVVGDGVWSRHELVRALYPAAPIDGALIRVASGEAGTEAIAAIDERFDSGRLTVPTPSAIVDFANLRGVPILLASVLGLLGAVTTGHLLVSSIRRRRRDLAILKTLGFRRSQVRATVAWQASVFTIIAALWALPIGIAGGRWIWTLIARFGGFVPDPQTPVLAIVLIPVAAVLVANVVALVPARLAAATSPASVLREE